jgi:cell division protein FtsL
MATLDRLAPPPASLPVRNTWTPRRALVITMTLAVTIALLQVLQSSNFANTGHQLQILEQQKTDLTAQQHQLEAEVAALASLDRTERAARDRLGMVPARNIQYVSVNVEAPDEPLLPRPLLKLKPAEVPSEPWWRSLIKALPLQ